MIRPRIAGKPSRPTRHPEVARRKPYTAHARLSPTSLLATRFVSHRNVPTHRTGHRPRDARRIIRLGRVYRLRCRPARHDGTEPNPFAFKFRRPYNYSRN